MVVIMSAQTIKTERSILRDIKKTDTKSLEYLLKPEIKNFSGPYMPHNKRQLSHHIDKIKGDTTWELLLMMVHLLAT